MDGPPLAAAADDWLSPVVAALCQPVALLDAELRVLCVNDAFVQAFVAIGEELVGRSVTELVGPPWNTPELGKRLAAVVAGTASLAGHEAGCEAAGIGGSSLRMNAVRLDGELGRGVRLLLALENLTDRGPTERRIEQRRRELEVELEARTAERDRASRELSQERQAHEHTAAMLQHADRLATVGKLAASVAHELGTPLNVVSARAKLIGRDSATGPAARQNADIIVEQTQRMTVLLRRMLDFSRKRQAERHADDLGALAEATRRVLQPMARQQGVELTVEARGENLSAHADATEFQQVLTNLIVNAIDAQPRGGTVRVCVRSDSRPPPGSREPKRYVVLEVADEGPGIQPDDRAKLFEPFFTTKAPGKGTGLGLPVCLSIAQEAGGWIDVDSAPGRGTRFSVYLPEDEPTLDRR